MFTIGEGSSSLLTTTRLSNLRAKVMAFPLSPIE